MRADKMENSHQRERQSQPEHLVQNFYIVMPNAGTNAGLTENSQTENVLQAIRAALGGAELPSPEPPKKGKLKDEK